ncbi:hypothetical protein, partial [Escherichia coli]
NILESIAIIDTVCQLLDGGVAWLKLRKKIKNIK